MPGSFDTNVYGTTSLNQTLAFALPPGNPNKSFSFSLSAAESGITLGTVTTSSQDLTVDNTTKTVTVGSGFTGTGTVTIPFTGGSAGSAAFTVTQSTASAQDGAQTAIAVHPTGWFRVTSLAGHVSYTPNPVSQIAISVPPQSGGKFTFALSPGSGVTLGTLAASANLTVDNTTKTVTVEDAFSGTGTVTVPLTGGTVASASFTVAKSPVPAQAGAQTSLTAGANGWFRVTALAASASVRYNQEACSTLTFAVPPAAAGTRFSFTVSPVGGISHGPITTSDSTNLTVSGSTVTVESGFNGTGTVTVPLTGGTVASTTYKIVKGSGTATAGSETLLNVNGYGWFQVTALGAGASFNSLSYMATGVPPASTGALLAAEHPVFLVSSVAGGGNDYRLNVGKVSTIYSMNLSGESGLTVDDNSKTVTANSALTPGMRSRVTVQYKLTADDPGQTASFHVQRLSSSISGNASATNLTLFKNSAAGFKVTDLAAGAYVRGNDLSYDTVSPGNYSLHFHTVGGATFNTAAVTFDSTWPGLTYARHPSGTSITITDPNSKDVKQAAYFTLHTNLGDVDPTIANNPDFGPLDPPEPPHGKDS